MTAAFNALIFNGASFNGAASSGPAGLLVTSTLKAIEIRPPSPASPWTIDPERSQELPPSY